MLRIAGRVGAIEHEACSTTLDLDIVAHKTSRSKESTRIRHFDETGSVVAQRILERWRREVENFAKVMPKDYKRVLEAARVAEERGMSVDEAIMAASHG